MTLSRASSTSCLPRYATRRRPERETFGPELLAIAEKLNQPLMPWQRLVAEVGCEIDPATRLPAYREVRVTVPRQSGKTTLFLSWQINRCVSRRWQHPQRSVFTAQTGKDARDKWLDELFPLIRNSHIRPLVATKGKRLEINEGMGNESIRFRTGSLIRLLSTSTTSGHSKTLHQAVMDEVWHDTDDRREQGLRPAMITMPDAQLLVCSTAGTDASVVLNRKVETGRAAVAADVGSGVAYFEYSAPDDWDPYDDESFYEFHPALCPDPPCRCAPSGERWRHTITIEAIRAERDAMETPEFCRAYGNRKPSGKLSAWQLFPEAAWRDRRVQRMRLADPVALGVDITPGRTWASISAAGHTDAGRGVEPLEHRPGEGWVIERLAELVERHRPCVVVTSDRALRDKAEGKGLAVYLAGAGDMAAAAATLYGGLVGSDPDVHHIGGMCPTCEDEGGAPLLCVEVAAAGVTKRDVGDAWALDRRSPTVDISLTVADSLALWGLSTPRIHSLMATPFALT